MTDITLRATKGTPLTHAEVDANFTNLKTTADAADTNASQAINQKANATSVGVAAGAANMGTYTGTTIPDSETAKQNLQSLETAVETKANATALGVTASAANMGTFTGTTIADNQTAKVGIQSLETAVELRTTIADLASASSSKGAGLVGYGQTAAYAAGTAGEALQREVIPTLVPYNIVGDGATDCSSGLQACITANPGKDIRLPPGSYLINTAINILTGLSLRGVRNRTTFILGTQNMNGFVVGDGTLTTRNLCGNVLIKNIDFNAKAGLAAFTSGSCIYTNYTYNTNIENCTFYGLDGATKKLFNGVSTSKGTNVWLKYCNFISLAGYGYAASGANSTTERTVNGRLDFCEWTDITLDCVNLGAYCEGIWITQPNMYQFDAAAIKIDTSLFNFDIVSPNIEISGTGSGITCTTAKNVNIHGGWIGGSVTHIGLSVSAASSRVFAFGTLFGQCKLDISGAECEIHADVVGDSVTAGDAITIASTAAGFSFKGKVQGWVGTGVVFTGEAGRSRIDAQFSGNTTNVSGDAWAPGGSAPANFAGCTSNGTFALTAAATLPVYHGRYFYQVSGATNITALPNMAAGTVITIQGGATAPTFVHSATLWLNGAANATVTTNYTLTLVSGGNGWLEQSRSF